MSSVVGSLPSAKVQDGITNAFRSLTIGWYVLVLGQRGST